MSVSTVPSARGAPPVPAPARAPLAGRGVPAGISALAATAPLVAVATISRRSLRGDTGGRPIAAVAPAALAVKRPGTFTHDADEPDATSLTGS